MAQIETGKRVAEAGLVVLFAGAAGVLWRRRISISDGHQYSNILGGLPTPERSRLIEVLPKRIKRRI